MRTRFIPLYFLCLFLATPLAAREFDPAAFPPRAGAETAFVEARDLSAADPSAATEKLKALLAEPSLPADAVRWALAALLPTTDAVAHLEAIAKDESSPFLPQSLDRLAAEAEAEGRWAEAAEHLARLEKVAEKEADRARALARLVTALDHADEIDGAEREARRLWIQYAHDPASAVAEEILRREGASPATDPERLARGEKLLEKGSREAAVEVLREVWERLSLGEGEKVGDRAAVGLALGRSLHFLRRYEESLPPLAAASTAPEAETEQTARFWRARSLFGLNRGDEGARDLVALADKYPSSPKSPGWLLQAYRVFDARSMASEAADAKKKLLSRHGGSDEAAEIRWLDGWELFNQGKRGEAARLLGDSARALPPGYLQARALYWTGECLLGAGRAEEGKKTLRSLVERYPVGYYTRLAMARIAGNGSGLPSDPRGQGGRPLGVPLPAAGEPAGEGRGAKAAAYLRLGFPDAARRSLAANGTSNSSSSLKLLYWSEDFHGLAEKSGCEWSAWGAKPDACAVSFAPAFPGSVASAAAEADIHPYLLLAVARTESTFDAEAFSPWEARGLMQFIPATARTIAGRLGLEDFRQEMLFEPGTAFRLGARYLRDLLDRFDGDVVSAVAAYNAGETAVSQWRKRWTELPPAEFVETIPYRETRHYVKKVLTMLDAYENVGRSGLWAEVSP